MKKIMIIAGFVLFVCFVWGVNMTNKSEKQFEPDVKAEITGDSGSKNSETNKRSGSMAFSYKRQNISVRDYPEGRRYTLNHMWVQPEGDYCWVGITDYFQEMLGDIVFVDPPEVGDWFSKNDLFGVIESVSMVGDLFMPLSGTILGVNNVLEDSPDVLNSNAHEYPLIMLKPDDGMEFDNLFTAFEYSMYVN